MAHLNRHGTGSLVGMILLLQSATGGAQDIDVAPSTANLNDPEFQNILQSGPASSAELEKVVTTYLANELREEAIESLAAYLQRPDKGEDPHCDYCQSLVRPSPSNADNPRSDLFYEAADRVVERAFEQGLGSDILQLAVISSAGHNQLSWDRAMYFLTTSAQLGVADEMKGTVVQILAGAGFNDAALAVATAVYEDPASSLHESEDLGRWIRYLTGEIERRQHVGNYIVSAVNR